MCYAKGRRASDEWALCVVQGEVDTAKWGCAHSFAAPLAAVQLPSHVTSCRGFVTLP